MAGDKELKPVSFRIDEDTRERIKQITDEIGGNQQEALNKLVDAWQFQKGKTLFDTDKRSEIEKFEEYISLITEKYMTSLRDNQNITETVRVQFQLDIQSQKDLIINLQEQLTVAKQLKEDATMKAKALTDENSNITNRVTAIMKELENSKNNYENILGDKNSLNKALTDSCNDLKAKVENMATEYNEFKDRAKLLDKTMIERDSLILDNETLKDTLQTQIKRGTDELEQTKQHFLDEIENIKQKAELTQQKALLDLERKYQDLLQQLKEDKQKEVDKYQQKYFDLLEKMKADKDEPTLEK